jgi:2-desacetyl-2-hydroxyethyl bacteriochlorophyllide A dehydrogenase
MKAVVFQGIGSVAVEDVPDPAIEQPGDAIVEVGLSGICGSDLHLYHGRLPLTPGETLGHEGVGVVREVGSAVQRCRPGDRVVASFIIVCGRCWYCRHGEHSLCGEARNLGFGAHGGGLGGAQAEFLRVPFADTNLLSIPDEVNDERGLFVGDTLTAGCYAASLAQIKPHETVAVVGAGPVGLFSAQAGLVEGALQVAVIDRVADRLAIADQVGAVSIDATRSEPREVVRELTGGRGADVAIEAVGNLSAFETARSVLRRGGRIVVIGVYGSETLELPMGAYWIRGIKIIFGGACPVHAFWDKALHWVRAGRIDPSPVISHRLPLDDAARGYELLDSQEARKVLLTP